MWYANESDSRKRNGGAGPQRAPERTVGQAAEPESQSHHAHKPIDPGMPRVEGVGASARAVRGTAPRSFARPWPRLRPGLADPRRFLQPPPQPGWRASRAAPTASSTPRQVPPTSPPPASLAAAPTPPCRAPTSHPRRNLLVRVCFFGHFLVHLDACPAAGSLAPFIFLCARPPSSHLRHLLIWWWRGELEMKGAPRQAEKRRSPSAGRGLGRGAPGSGCHRPAGRGPQALNGRRGEIWEGDPEG